ncbi:MAG: hypothetical protein WEF86_01840 [Gemmatimonadota bacterium]
MPLDFASGVRLFMGTEDELARGLGVSVADLRAMRTTPGRTPGAMLERLGVLLEERGRGMMRVGQMLREESRD